MKTGVEAHRLPDLGPEVYSRWHASKLRAITEQLQRRLILGLIGEVSGLRILDVGCGDGDLAVELWKRGASVTGFDVSRDMIFRLVFFIIRSVDHDETPRAPTTPPVPNPAATSQSMSSSICWRSRASGLSFKMPANIPS